MSNVFLKDHFGCCGWKVVGGGVWMEVQAKIQVVSLAELLLLVFLYPHPPSLFHPLKLTN